LETTLKKLQEARFGSLDKIVYRVRTCLKNLKL
jgi:hypothetical protein